MATDSKVIILYRGEIHSDDAVKLLCNSELANRIYTSLNISRSALGNEAMVEYILSYLFFHYSAADTISKRAKEWIHLTLRPELIKNREQLLVTLFSEKEETLYVEEWHLLIAIIQSLGLINIGGLKGSGRRQYDLILNTDKETRPADVKEEDWSCPSNELITSLMTFYLHADEEGKSILWTNYWIHLANFIHPKAQSLDRKLKAEFKYLEDDILLLVLNQLRAI